MDSQEQQNDPQVPPNHISGMPQFLQDKKQDAENNPPKIHNSEEVFMAILKACALLLLLCATIVMGFYMLKLVGLVATETGGIIENTGRYINRLFNRARYSPYPNAEFGTLILIAIFVGWTIRRFMNMRNRDRDKD